MPTYEYQCKGCGHRFDLFQKLSDPAPTICPKCEKGPVQKVFTSVGIIFKGSGFYVNDYRKPEPKAETAETKSDTEAKPGVAGAPEAKPGAATESGSETKKEAAPTPEKKSETAPASEPTRNAA